MTLVPGQTVTSQELTGNWEYLGDDDTKAWSEPHAIVRRGLHVFSVTTSTLTPLPPIQPAPGSYRFLGDLLLKRGYDDGPLSCWYGNGGVRYTWEEIADRVRTPVPRPTRDEIRSALEERGFTPTDGDITNIMRALFSTTKAAA